MHINNTYTLLHNVNTTLSHEFNRLWNGCLTPSLYNSLDLYLTIAIKVKDETSAESRMYLCKFDLR